MPRNAWCVCLITSLFCAASISMLFQFAASLPNLVGIKFLNACHFLVGGLEHVLFFHSVGNFIIPTDELIFFRWVGLNHQAVLFLQRPTFRLCIRFAKILKWESIKGNQDWPSCLFPSMCQFPKAPSGQFHGKSTGKSTGDLGAFKNPATDCHGSHGNDQKWSGFQSKNVGMLQKMSDMGLDLKMLG